MAWLLRRFVGRGVVAEHDAPRRFLWLGGRRHLADAPYVLPSDQQEINRLDFQHYMLRQALRGNYAAPLREPASILDVGSGTGRWALEMAQLFPSANVVGTDLVEPKAEALPGDASLPDNYTFVPGNVLERLPFPDNTFDFVHMRLLLFAIAAEKWPAVAAELVRVTRPGGWVESVETGPQQDGGPAMDMLVRWITEVSVRRGVDTQLGPRVASFFADAGLINIQKRDVRLPVGRYGGRLGNMAAVDVFGVMSGVKPLVVAQGITDAQSYDTMLAQARADLDTFQCTLPFYIAYGQKPRVKRR
ncbi:MAG: class I SAM-dependent methyltransferase [Ktedonobacterales bacterium]